MLRLIKALEGRSTLESLDRDRLIEMILAQADRVKPLVQRVADLEANGDHARDPTVLDSEIEAFNAGGEPYYDLYSRSRAVSLSPCGWPKAKPHECANYSRSRQAGAPVRGKMMPTLNPI
jgi:hypothetical protein